MKLFYNLKVGTKIVIGYLLTLALMAIVGALAVVQLNQINATVINLSDNLAKDQHLSDQIVSQILLVRFYANKYIRSNTQTDLDRYKEEFTNLEKLLEEAQVMITQPERAAMLTSINAKTQEYEATFTEIDKIIIDRDKLVAEVLDQQGPLALDKMEQLRVIAFQANNTAVSFDAGNAQNALLSMRMDVFKYLQEGDEKLIQKFEEYYQQAQTSLAKLDNELKDPVQRKLTEETKTAMTAYYQAFKKIQTDYVRQNELTSAKLDVLGPDIRLIGTKMSDSVNFDLETASVETNSLVAQTQVWLIGIIAVAIIVSLGLGVIIIRTITIPLYKVTNTAKAIAVGDLSQSLDISSKDEMGILTNAFNQMMIYLQQMAQTATCLAEGDLTVNISPQSNQDVLGNAFSRMILNLRGLITQVADTANTVGVASSQLATAAEQAGQASQQVAATIQQITQGASQQTQGVTEAASNVEQMARASEGIARGAQEQAQGVAKTSDLTVDMTNIVTQVGQTARSVNDANAKVTQAARVGVAAVGQTGQGMEAIRTRTLVAADKVKEMGNRSREISRIVETIDDIADKTDMLALNAAVEAARAGEYGRGFAVVADQVRKLSEDSKNATRDIGDLIERVQDSIREAVAAMDNTITEVDNGARLTGDTVHSLEQILQAAENAAVLAEQITTAVAQLKQRSEGVVTAIETVSAVVEENTAVSEEMAASSQEVMQVMENVAGVAEENSAAAEEVSAAAEEMSAQVEEVVASSQELSSLAGQLREAITQFRIEEGHALRVEQPNRRRTRAARSGESRSLPLIVAELSHQSNGQK